MLVAPQVAFRRLLQVPCIDRKDVMDLKLSQLTSDERSFKQLE